MRSTRSSGKPKTHQAFAGSVPRANRVVGEFEGEYGWQKIPSNIVFRFVRRGRYQAIGTAEELAGEPSHNMFMRSILLTGEVSSNDLLIVNPGPKGLYEVSSRIKRCHDYGNARWTWTDGESEVWIGPVVSCKVVEVLPLTQSRVCQLAYMFVVFLLREVGIDFSANSTHRQFGQWAAAMNVNLEELKTAARPLIELFRTEALALPFDQSTPAQKVPSLVGFDRTRELAFLFVKMLVRMKGVNLSPKALDKKLGHWASEMRVPSDELRLALRPLILELETEIFSSSRQELRKVRT